MNEFRLGEFLNRHGMLMVWTATVLENEKAKLGAGGHLDSLRFQRLLEDLEFYGNFCNLSNFCEASEVISRALKWNQAPESIDLSALQNQISNICQVAVGCARKHRYLRIRQDRSECLDQPELFGKLVYESFPSARQDITESGNCLAAECNTASVFHLMRAAEVALQALAKDRRVEYPNSSVDEQQCGQLITSLDAKLSGLRNADKKLWPSEALKNEQIRFYHTTVIEFRSFNEAWRKHVCHAGGDSFYDSVQALSIFGHVKTLMQMLGPRITEFSTTPEYWVS